MKYFTKYIVVFLICILSQNNLFSNCTFTINPPTVIQPTCGDNGTISIKTTPALSPNSKFYIYKDGLYLSRITGIQANLNSLAPGTYKIVVEDNGSGCKDSVNNIIIYPATNNLQVTYLVTDSPTCDTSRYNSAGKISLIYTNFTPPVTVNWNYSSTNHDSIASGLVKGTYSAVVIDKNNCKATVNNIVIPSKEVPITVDNTNVIASTCNKPNGTIYLYFKGGVGTLSFLWQNQNPPNATAMPLTDLVGGTYTCDVTDELKCKTYSFPVTVPVFPGPKIKITGTDSICANAGFGTLNAIVVSGDPLQMGYLWYKDTSEVSFSSSNSVSSLTAGVYKVVAFDPSGCLDSSTHTIYNYPEKRIRIIPDKYQIVKNQKTFIRIDSPKGIYNLVWAPTENIEILSDSNIWVFPDKTTYYSLVANYGPGCITKAFQEIEVVDPIDSLIFPNLFTPNGDNLNDKYYLRGEINNNDNFEFKVYDRWGNNVYNAYDSKFQWDGTDEKGKPLNYGIYTFIVKYIVVYPVKKEIIQSGQIMLER